MTNSTQSLLNTIEELQALGKTPKVKVLKTRGPRKGETMTRNAQHGRGSAMGSMNSNDTSAGGASHAVGGGKGQTITKVTGLGSSMVSNLSKVQSDYQKQIKADRKAAAQERMQYNLDALLADIRG